MESLYQIHNRFLNSSKKYYARQDELRDKIAELEKQRSEDEYPHFLTFLRRFGKRLKPLIKGTVKIEIYGPFGLGNECSIYFNGKNDKILASATFTRYGDGYGIKDYSKNTGTYPKGSIGEMNGGNYNTIKITNKMTAEWFVKFMKKNRNN